jgi:hypothetical protein
MESSNGGISRTKERCSTLTGNPNIELENERQRLADLSRELRAYQLHQTT